MTFDDTITSIGDNAFSGYSSLASITIPNSINEIGDNAFSGCSSLASITIPDSVTYIGEGAFYGCSSLESITIPDSVTEIGVLAFSFCSSLESITIPDSVTYIGGGAFEGCSSLESITIPNCGIGMRPVYGCTGELIINNKIIETDYNDFRFFYGELKQYVWHYGSNFSSIIIGEDVTKIGIAAFYGYSSLASITIPDSITEIGGSAFYNCWNLTSIYCKSTTPPKCYDTSLAYGGSGFTIYVPTESVDKYQTADVWQHYASNIVGYDF